MRRTERYQTDPEYRAKAQAAKRGAVNRGRDNLRRVERYNTDPEYRARVQAMNQKANRSEVGIARRQGNRDHSAALMRARRKDPGYRLMGNLRTRIWNTLKGRNKSARTIELLGCSIAELRAHLEKQFRPGMTWENRGPVWHVDHIRPCASFDLSKPEEQKVCFHFSNLQPLFALENIRKSNNWKDLSE